jgi:hypothetical protein
MSSLAVFRYKHGKPTLKFARIYYDNIFIKFLQISRSPVTLISSQKFYHISVTTYADHSGRAV